MKQKYTVRNFIEITLGVLIIVLGLYFFLLPMVLVTGGVNGLMTLFNGIFAPGFIPWLFSLICNVVLLFVGLIFLGKEFFFKTIYATLLTPLSLFILEIANVSDNLILDLIDPNQQLLIAAVAGGILIGIGLGIVLKNNATTGGMDVVQNILHKKLKVPFSVAMYAIDGLIILAGSVYYIMESKIEYVFFAVISMIITGILTDKISMEGKAGYTFFIITEKGEEIKSKIFSEMDNGVTEIEVTGGYTNDKKEMLICTVRRQGEYRLKEIVKNTDDSAFIFFSPTKEILGEGFSRKKKISGDNSLNINNENTEDKNS